MVEATPSPAACWGQARGGHTASAIRSTSPEVIGARPGRRTSGRGGREIRRPHREFPVEFSHLRVSPTGQVVPVGSVEGSGIDGDHAPQTDFIERSVVPRKR